MSCWVDGKWKVWAVGTVMWAVGTVMWAVGTGGEGCHVGLMVSGKCGLWAQ